MTNPIVYITGASSGLGQAMGMRYFKAGYRLVLVARRADLITQWLSAAGIGPDQALVLAADVADIGSIVQAGQACINRWGCPDVVIANAGISMGMDTAYPDDLDVMTQTFTTNVTGLAATFSPFIKAMQARGSGSLVGIASVAGIRGLPGHGAYCSSKAAAISYLESLRIELRPTGIKVVTIAPGYVATPLTSKNRYPMPFLMQPEPFAEQAFTAIEKQVSYRVIPWQMGVVAKIMRLLPNTLFDRLAAGQPRKQRRNE
jgi:short-subunit dehydrogenase